ncbi:CBS domain-containing protein [Acidianus sulfidivorans JP7]|uniref:Signal transduction protein n=1 Tax=Acidianus sulfidivorans JP7 TaxID=619593 RepID=A0A2U9ILZ3_9CREN|nr:CBS domain-containing protein [Acidianus sulfidivorans]AWR97068.1 CBS domain-containing protein [Acidianus sulfidivorans JP7]
MLINGSDIISLNCDATVEDAVFFMYRNNIRRIVVICESKIKGIFTVDEALKSIIYKSEVKLKDIELKKPVISQSNNLYEVVKLMVENLSDSVIYKDKIITEKDIVFNYDFSNYDDTVSSIANSCISIEGYTNLITAIEIMIKNSIRHLPVIEGSLLGMLSARDIIYYYSQHLNLDVPVRDVMTPYLVYVKQDTKIGEAVKIMKERKIGSIYVLDNKLVSLRDFIKYIFSKMKSS